MKSLYSILGVLIIFGITGCSTVNGFFGNERDAGSVISPGERLVTKIKKRNDFGEKIELICSEPPPDVANSIFSALAASASGEVNDKGAVQANVASVFDSDFIKLFERSQGIQGLRDGMYRSCEAFLNGGITQDTYGQQMTYMTSTLNFLVTVELCGKILEAKDLTLEEATVDVKVAKDLRPDLYRECIATAKVFALGILESHTKIQLAK